MEIAIISDTHMPRGARRLPPECLARLSRANLIIHAGDLCTFSVLRELEAINPVAAVHGNVDDPAVKAQLPETVLLPVPGGPAVAVLHDAGPSRGRLQRLRARFPEAQAVIFGHSHMPLHERAADGFQIFNPGSPTERRRAARYTMGVARVTAGRVQFELVDLSPRG
jgi:putative phosphoesterase